MKEIIMPPSRACGICRNRMNELCIEECALKKDYRFFDPNMEMPLELFPDLTMEEYRQLNGRMKGEWIFVELKKMTEVQNGTRTTSYSRRSCRIPQNLEGEGLLPDQAEEDTVHQDSEKCESEVE